MMRRLKNETGYSIIVAIVIFTVLSMMGTAMIDMTSFDARIKSQEVQALQSTEIGNAGIQYALEKIKGGENPNNVTKNLGYGQFQISTDPASSRITINGQVGASTKVQTLSALFSKECIEINTTQTEAHLNLLRKIRLKKTCNDAFTIDKIRLFWDSGGPNSISEIQMDTATIYGPGLNGNPNEILNVSDSAINNDGWHNLEFYFSQNVDLPNNFIITFFFLDESEKSANFSLPP